MSDLTKCNETTKLEIERFEGKLQGIQTLLGRIQAYSGYIIARLEEKTLDELKFDCRDELTFALVDLKDKVASLEKDYYETGLSLRYEIVEKHGEECIRLLD
ncbi:hypothetical protein N0W54_003335 [Escherichia coli]|nr:hypothetical protein [Escherichia coli]